MNDKKKRLACLVGTGGIVGLIVGLCLSMKMDSAVVLVFVGMLCGAFIGSLTVAK